MSKEPELVLDAKAGVGEGAIWDSRRRLLYWVDILGEAVHVYDSATGRDRAIGVGQPVGTVVPRRSGGLMLALRDGFASLDPDTEKLDLVWRLEEPNRFNDGKCDPAGRFWAGTMAAKSAPGTANLYCLFADLSVKRMLTGVSTSNGIAWSLDARTMYYIDTPTRAVAAFDYDVETAEIGNRRVVVRVPPDVGVPDGMTIDAEGMLWVAHWGGRCVARWDPANGELLETVAIPASNVSSCAFGGTNLDELYITTARAGLDEEVLQREPQAGGLFVVRPGVRGVPAFGFAG